MKAMSKQYTPALRYDWLTRLYDPVLQLTMPERKFKTALVNQMQIKPNERILDFGCGSLTLTMMAANSAPFAEFHGVDVDSKILLIGQKKLETQKLPIQVLQYDGRTLPYPDNYFDKVMSCLVFHHLTLPQKYLALDEICRVLKPSGEFHIADFGKPADRLQRLGFFIVQLLDGFETTKDNVKNFHVSAIEQFFHGIEHTAYFRSIVGTVRLVKAKKWKRSIL